jgi:hypothetical protein
MKTMENEKNYLLTGVTHELKCWPEYYKYVRDGSKPFEVRKNDRNYQVGDILNLKEWHPDNGYTGVGTQVVVTYILSSNIFNPLPAGFVVMGIAPYLVPSTELKQAERMREAYDEYIQLLTDEISELAGMAAVHGWKSTRHEKGIELRKKIQDLCTLSENPEENPGKGEEKPLNDITFDKEEERLVNELAKKGIAPTSTIVMDFTEGFRACTSFVNKHLDATFSDLQKQAKVQPEQQKAGSVEQEKEVSAEEFLKSKFDVSTSSDGTNRCIYEPLESVVEAMEEYASLRSSVTMTGWPSEEEIRKEIEDELFRIDPTEVQSWNWFSTGAEYIIKYLRTRLAPVDMEKELEEALNDGWRIGNNGETYSFRRWYAQLLKDRKEGKGI